MENHRILLATDIKEIVSTISTKTAVLEARLTQIERERRDNNLILFGVNEEFSSYWDLEAYTCNMLNTEMGLELQPSDFDKVSRIGKQIKEKARPILIRLSKSIQSQNYTKYIQIKKR